MLCHLFAYSMVQLRRPSALNGQCHKESIFSKELPEARPPADAEGDDPLVVDELSGLLVDEAVGPERPRLLPVRGVVHDVVQVGEHLRNRIDNCCLIV